jgi:NACHT domain
MSDGSSVIFHRLRENPRVGISYFFFNHSNREQTAEDVIRVLLRQVTAQLQTIPPEVLADYSKFQKDPHRLPPSRETFANLLKSCLDAFPGSCFILLDAYDEFRNAKCEDREREGLRSFLAEISQMKRIRILITTRPHWRAELENVFAEAQVAEIRGDLKDVTRYLDSELQPRRHLNEGTKNLIRTKILEANRDNPW